MGKTTLIMSNEFNNPDSLDNGEFDAPVLPTGLNILTILTIIGCVIGLLLTVFGFLTADRSYQKKDEAIAQMKSAPMPSFLKKIIPPVEQYEELIIKSYENKWPLFILGLVALVFCFFGALQMRKLKKQGFLFYAIGQLLPFLTTILFIGTFAFYGFTLILFLLSILFLIFYAFQRKHLVY